MPEVKEGYCTKCEHLQVCKFIEKMERAMKIAETSEVEAPVQLVATCDLYKQEVGNSR